MEREKSQMAALPTPAATRPPRVTSRGRRELSLLCLLSILSIWYLSTHIHVFTPQLPLSKKENFQQCSIDNFVSTGFPFLKTAEPLPVSEFVDRRDRLAKALVADKVDAFVAEPGFTFSYYVNCTQPEWEEWEPEERPFLMVVRPQELSNGDIVANTTFLVAHFEEARAKLLDMPFTEEIQTIIWEEHWNPYTTLWTDPMWGEKLSPKLMVDDEMRDFIQRGLGETGFDVVGLGGEIEAVRQVKTEREIGNMRAVNTGTVEAIRALRECIYEGVTEKEVAEVLGNTLRAAGFEPFFDLVLFGEQAALPHGGYNGSKPLLPGDFVLIDVGAHLNGYSSDITRTFYPPFFPNPPPPSYNLTEQLSVWKIVLDAQSAAVNAMVNNATAASVDIAARDVIEKAGYGEYFAHRVGHSIGIKAHESPYLNKGNWASRLRPGMVFTAEPGVYVWDHFGVRHEDVLLVTENGAESLSGSFAKSPWEP